MLTAMNFKIKTNNLLGEIIKYISHKNPSDMHVCAHIAVMYL